MGEFMAEVEPENQKDQQRSGVTVNVNSSDNYVVTGDRIEINIHIGDRESSHAARKNRGSARNKESTVDIRRLMASAVEAISQRHPEQRVPSSRLAPATIREQ
jgi:hypothetical protein